MGTVRWSRGEVKWENRDTAAFRRPSRRMALERAVMGVRTAPGGGYEISVVVPPPFRAQRIDRKVKSLLDSGGPS